jgi:parallel beta-helix repeat protein
MKRLVGILIGLSLLVGSAIGADYFKYNAKRITFPDNSAFVGSPWVDVRAFGAKLDGATDDSAAFIAAVAAANPNGTVLIPGTMAIGSNGWTGIDLTGLDNVTIRGEKGGSIKLLYLPSQTLPMYGAYISLLIRNSSNVSIRDLYFNGNGIKSILLALFESTDLFIDHNKFHNIEFSDVPRPTLSMFGNTRSKVTNNDFVGSCYQFAMGLGFNGYMETQSMVLGNTFNNPRGCMGVGAYYSTIVNNTFRNCDVGINIGVGSFPSHDVTMVGNIFKDGNSTCWAFRTDGGWTDHSQSMRDMSYVGNVVDNCNGISASYLINGVVTGNVIRGADIGIATGPGINVNISGNTIVGPMKGELLNYAAIAISGNTYTLESGERRNINISNNIISDFHGGTGTSGIGSTVGTDGLSIIGNTIDNVWKGIYLYPYDNNVIISNNLISNATTRNIEILSGGPYDMNVHGFNNIVRPGLDYGYGLFMKHRVNSTNYSTGSAAPADNTASGTNWSAGDIVWNTGTDNVLGWKCIAGGTPGTWGAMTVTMP